MAIKKEIEIIVTTNNAEAKVKSLGNEIEDVGGVAEKSMDRYSGAIKKSNPLVEKLNELTGGLSNTFLDVADKAKKFGIATRGALIATGIGAFVVALGVVVAYWDDIVEFITKANQRLQKQIDLNKENLDSLSHQYDLLDKQQKIIELQGGSTEKIRDLKKQVILLQQTENDELLENLRIQLEREKAQNRELTFWEKTKSLIFSAFSPVQGSYERLKAMNEESEKTAEIQGMIEEAEERQLDLQIALLSLEKERLNVNEGIQKAKVSSIFGANVFNFESGEFENGLDRLRKGAVQVGDIGQQLANTRLATELDLQRAITEAEQNGALARQRIAEIENQQKLTLTQDTLGKMTAILGENTVAGKLSASALALMNTYLGVTQVLSNKTTLPEPFGTINKIASVALTLKTGFDAIKNINSVKLPPFAKGGGSSGQTAPSFNLVAGTEGSQITNALQNQTNPVKTYVVSSEVSSSQELDRKAIANSTL